MTDFVLYEQVNCISNGGGLDFSRILRLKKDPGKCEDIFKCWFFRGGFNKRVINPE